MNGVVETQSPNFKKSILLSGRMLNDAFNEYSKTEEYQKELEAITEDIKKILPKTYTKEDFKMIKLTDITK